MSLGVLFSCADNLVVDISETVAAEESCQNFTIEEAMSVFSDEYDRVSGISGKDAVSESPFVWESGTVVPVWRTAARHVIRGKEDSYVVPMLSSVRYYASKGKDVTLVRCDQSLIISKNVNSGRASIRIVFSIPDDELKRSGMFPDFSGLLVYTDLSGKFKKIEKYEVGEMCDGVYFGESESEIAKERHRLFINRIMEGVTVFKVSSFQIDTRCPAPGDTVEYNDSINPSYCNGSCFPDLWWQSPDFDFWNDSIAPIDTAGVDDYLFGNGNELAAGGGGDGYIGSPKNTGSSSENTPIRPVDCSPYFGKAEYYKKRYDDYVFRYRDKAVKEIYYITYGFKYCRAFSDLGNTKDASADLKEWIKQTMVLLQEKLEHQLQSDPTIENDPKRLMSVAFKTHPEAYLEGGLLKLSVGDKLKIILTVEHEDLFSKLGRNQIYEVVKAQIDYYIKHPDACIKDASDIKRNWGSIKQSLYDYCSGITTRSGSLDVNQERVNELRDILFEEIVNYFYDTVDGFAIDY